MVTMCCIAVVNVIVDRRLVGITPPAIVAGMCVTAATFAILLVLFRHPLGLPTTMPERTGWLLLAVCGMCMVLGDYCYFNAYRIGGSATTLTTVGILVPVFTSVILFAIDGRKPTTMQFLGWICAAASIMFVSR